MAVTRDLWLVLRARDEASRIVRSFGTNVTRTAKTTSAHVAASTMALAQARLSAAQLAASQATNAKQMATASVRVAEAQLELARATELLEARYKTFEARMRSVGQHMQQFAMTSMLVGSAMAGAGAAGIAFIHSVTKVAAEYDRQVKHTITQIDDTKIKLEDVAEVGRRVARSIATPFEKVQETLFFVFSSMDVNITQAEELLRGFAKEAIAGQSTIESAAKSSISILNSLGLTTKDLTRIQDVQFQVIRKGIITYEELSSVVGRALPATARAGQSFETLGAMMAFLTRNGLSAAMAATSAARALESFAHPTVVKRLGQIGINVRDAKGEFLPLVAVMEQMNKKMKEMSQPERSKFMQELFKGAGGTIQARRFWDTAFKNFDQFRDMIGHMQNSTGVFENAYDIMSNTVAAKSELIRNKWMLIKEALGRAVLPSFLQFLGVVERVAGWFEKLPQGTKEIISQFILWGSVISVIVGVMVVLVGTLAFFVSGIMLAGTALVGVLAGIAAVTSGLLILIAGFTLAWQKSESFRSILSTLGSTASKIWAEIKKAGEEVAAAYNDKLKPSLDKLWEVIETKVGPAVKDFVEKLTTQVIPKVKEAKDIIVDFTDNAFEHLANILDNTVIPALENLSDWWNKNGDTLKPFLLLLGEMVKWFLIISAVVLGSALVALPTMIGVVINQFTMFLLILKNIWGWIKSAGMAVWDFITKGQEKAQGIAESIKEFFGNAWNKVKELVTNAIDAVGDAVKAGLDWLYNNIWKPFWNTFGGVIKEAWGLVVDTAKFFITLFQEIIKDWIQPAITFIKEKWNALKEFFSELWNSIVSKTKEKVSEVNNWIRTKFEESKKFISETWTKIKDKIGELLNAIYDKYIKPVVDKIKQLWEDHLKGLWENIVGNWNRIRDFFKERIEAIKQLFKNGKDWLLDAGKNIIQGLIDGITDKIKAVRDKLKDLTEKIKEWKGPRAVDLKLLVPAGQAIMRGLMSGISSKIPELQKQLNTVTDRIGNIPVEIPIPRQAQESRIENRTINQSITVNTQEIDPRKHAAELGFELDGRL